MIIKLYVLLILFILFIELEFEKIVIFLIILFFDLLKLMLVCIWYRFNFWLISKINFFNLKLIFLIVIGYFEFLKWVIFCFNLSIFVI